MKVEAIFYEEETNEITTMIVDIKVYLQFSLGSNVTATSYAPFRKATMIGIVDQL